MGEQADPGRLRSTFDAVATLYDQARPGYPERLFDDLVSLSGTGPGAKVLEISCGTAQATVPLARRGYHVLCVELGDNLATIARGKLADCPQEAWVLTLRGLAAGGGDLRAGRLGHGVSLGRPGDPLPQERPSPPAGRLARAHLEPPLPPGQQRGLPRSPRGCPSPRGT